MLGFQAEPGVAAERPAVAAVARAVQEIAAVELQSRLGGQHLHREAGHRKPGGEAQPHRVRGAVEHEIMVVAAGDPQLRIGLADARADAAGCQEIEGRAGHRTQLPGRDQGRIHGREASGGKGERMVQDVAAAGQVEVAVVGEVEHGRPAGAGLIVDRERAIPCQRIAHRNPQRAGEALVAVRAEMREGQRTAARLRRRLPQRPVEALRPAMQRIRRVVHRDPVVLALQREAAIGDAVGEAADGGAEIAVIGQVFGGGGETQHHLHGGGIRSRHPQRQ
nr:hypothetical protein [Siccirubricoccus sp. G192]